MSEHTTLWQKIEAWWHLLWHHAQAGTLPDAPVAGGVPVTIPPAGGTVTPPAPPIPPPGPSLPAGIIGQPNGDLLVRVQSVEDARARYSNVADTDAEPNNQWWAMHLPHWWAVDEVARAYPAGDIAAQYVLSQCNKSMLTGAMQGNAFNESSWHVWQDRQGSTEAYPNPLDVAVVAGPNNFGSLAQTGFPGIKIADFPALLERSRAHTNSRGKISDDAPWVATPGGGGSFK